MNERPDPYIKRYNTSFRLSNTLATIHNTLIQGWANSVLEGHCPAEFSSNSNQIHLNQLVIVFKLTRATGEVKAGEFNQG